MKIVVGVFLLRLLKVGRLFNIYVTTKSEAVAAGKLQTESCESNNINVFFIQKHKQS